MIGAVAWQAPRPRPRPWRSSRRPALWTAASDVAVALALQAASLAAAPPPRRFDRPRRPRLPAPWSARPAWRSLVGAMLSLPVALVVLALPAGQLALRRRRAGCAAVFTLMALRLVLRIREDGRITEDLVRSEEDFRELVEASSDGIAIVDGELPAAVHLPGRPHACSARRADGDADGSLLDLLARRGPRRASAPRAGRPPPAAAPPLHFRVAAGRRRRPASSRSPTTSARAAAAACCTCATSPPAGAASASSSAWPTPTT